MALAVLVEVDAYNPNTGAVETLRQAYLNSYTHPTAPGPYPNLVLDPADWAVTTSGTLFGILDNQLGTAVFDNNKGDYDKQINEDWGFDGREYRVEIIDTESDHAFRIPLFTAIVAHALADLSISNSGPEKRLRLVLQSNKRYLNEFVHQEIYAGTATATSGIEGPEELKGRRKRNPLGDVKNYAPDNVNPTLAVFDLGKDTDITTAVGNDGSFYEGGIPLTRESDYSGLSDLESNAPTSGAYRLLFHTDGRTYARMSRPPRAQVTVDVQRKSGAGNSTSLDDVLFLLAADLTGSQITSLTGISSISVGIVPREDDKIRQVIEDLLPSGDLAMYSKTSSSLTVENPKNLIQFPNPIVRLVEPRPDTILGKNSLSDNDDVPILSFRWTTSDDGNEGLPIHSLRLEYKPLETTQTVEDLLGDPTDPQNDPVGGTDRRERLRNKFLTTDPVEISASEKSRHPFGDDVLIRTYASEDPGSWPNDLDPQDRLDRRNSLRQGAEVVLPLEEAVEAQGLNSYLEVLSNVKIVAPSLGTSVDGWVALVTGIEYRPADLNVRLTLRGPRPQGGA